MGQLHKSLKTLKSPPSVHSCQISIILGFLLNSTCIFWNIFCSTRESTYKRLCCLSPYAEFFCRQNPFLQVSFYDWQTMTRPAKNYSCCLFNRNCYLRSRGTRLSEFFHSTKKGKYPVLRTNTKPQQLVNRTIIYFSIASLVYLCSIIFCASPNKIV